MLIALVALTMVACKKDNEFITPTASFNKTQTATTSIDNHIHTLGRKCASSAYMEQKLQDPIYRANHEKYMAAFERNLKTRSAQSRSACSTPTILPIAIHYQGAANAEKSCLISAAKAAVAVLNADFQGKNSDIVLWDNKAAAFYPNISNGDACLEFQLGSKNHPAGFDLQDGDLAITINKVTGDESADWKGYINIFVGDADGSLGYAPLGGSGNGDGVMISQSAFTIGTTCGNIQGNSPNDLGRTLTHEMGHYLNLDHVWGDGGCESDDQVADTPNQADSNYGCPTLGSTKGCTEEALHMSFMDYPDDACMYMFSAGQTSRMESWVTSGLADNLKKDVFGEVTDGGDTDTGDDSTDTEGGDDTDDDGDNTDDNTDGEEDGGYEDEGDFDEETENSTISIQVTLDDYGTETIFAIEDADGYEISTWGPFEDGQAGQVITEEIDLPRGAYTFVIHDGYGDGICCDEGNGRWNLSKDGTQIKSSDGKFGYFEEYDFAIGNARLKAATHRKDKKDLVKLANKQRTARK